MRTAVGMEDDEFPDDPPLARWRLLQCIADEVDPARDRHEWIWTVESTTHGRSKQVVVFMPRSLEIATDDLLETPGGMACVASGGRSAVEEFLSWAEPPDEILMRGGRDPRTAGGAP